MKVYELYIAVGDFKDLVKGNLVLFSKQVSKERNLLVRGTFEVNGLASITARITSKYVQVCGQLEQRPEATVIIPDDGLFNLITLPIRGNLTVQGGKVKIRPQIDVAQSKH